MRDRKLPPDSGLRCSERQRTTVDGRTYKPERFLHSGDASSSRAGNCLRSRVLGSMVGPIVSPSELRWADAIRNRKHRLGLTSGEVEGVNNIRRRFTRRRPGKYSSDFCSSVMKTPNPKFNFLKKKVLFLFIKKKKKKKKKEYLILFLSPLPTQVCL